MDKNNLAPTQPTIYKFQSRTIKFSIWFPAVLVVAFAAGYLFWQQILIPGPYDLEPVNIVRNHRNTGTDTSAWQIGSTQLTASYRNEKHGFEFKYPSADKIDTGSSGIVRIDSPHKDNGEKEGFSLGEYFIEVSLFSNGKYTDYIGDIKTVDKGGYKIISGDRISAYFSPLSGYDTFIEKDGLILVFAASLGDIQAKNEVNQILSTFKFL